MKYVSLQKTVQFPICKSSDIGCICPFWTFLVRIAFPLFPLCKGLFHPTIYSLYLCIPCLCMDLCTVCVIITILTAKFFLHSTLYFLNVYLVITCMVIWIKSYTYMVIKCILVYVTLSSRKWVLMWTNNSFVGQSMQRIGAELIYSKVLRCHSSSYPMYGHSPTLGNNNKNIYKKQKQTKKLPF